MSEQEQAVLEVIEKRGTSISNRAIARITGIDEKTIRAIRARHGI